MNTQTRRKPHGRRICCPGGYQAYVPEPLPPLIGWSAELPAALWLADRCEVGNDVVALEYGVERRELPLSLRLVRELHERLMRGVRGDVATPAEFRRSRNSIGPGGCSLATATFVPPPPDRLMECLATWESFLHDDSLPPLVHAALAHSQFEAITRSSTGTAAWAVS